MTWSISLVDCGIWADSQRKFLLEIRFLPSPRPCHVLEERWIEKGKEGKYDSGRQRNSCVQRRKQKIISWCLTMIESHFNLNTYNFGECTSFKEENCNFFNYKNLKQEWSHKSQAVIKVYLCKHKVYVLFIYIFFLLRLLFLFNFWTCSPLISTLNCEMGLVKSQDKSGQSNYFNSANLKNPTGEKLTCVLS